MTDCKRGRTWARFNGQLKEQLNGFIRKGFGIGLWLGLVLTLHACDDPRETSERPVACRCNTDCPDDQVCMDGRRVVDGCVSLSDSAGMCQPKSSQKAEADPGPAPHP